MLNYFNEPNVVEFYLHNFDLESIFEWFVGSVEKMVGE